MRFDRMNGRVVIGGARFNSEGPPKAARSAAPRTGVESGSWERGEPVHFGTLTVARDGIGSGKKQLAWSAFSHLDIDGGWVRVCAKGKMFPWAMLPRARVPNALLFREVVEAAGRG
jgi:hypothetical protein